MIEVIKKEIYIGYWEKTGSEILVPLPPEINYKPYTGTLPNRTPLAIAVYKWECVRAHPGGRREQVYKFSGVRVQN